ncbi:hypothetical protein FNF28_07786 [Cafeteria roenbergensis]|uniref:Uncharacterized protein n=1 Tax=Cafeteria roenbergensis TaxID=33653 RepID=A0A5A8C1S1_CAFRO|nr:hypothetical protein FNF28_07786 [Cafeteria roenbergensis]
MAFMALDDHRDPMLQVVTRYVRPAHRTDAAPRAWAESMMRRKAVVMSHDMRKTDWPGAGLGAVRSQAATPGMDTVAGKGRRLVSQAPFGPRTFPERDRLLSSQIKPTPTVGLRDEADGLGGGARAPGGTGTIHQLSASRWSSDWTESAVPALSRRFGRGWKAATGCESSAGAPRSAHAKA